MGVEIVWLKLLYKFFKKKLILFLHHILTHQLKCVVIVLLVD